MELRVLKYFLTVAREQSISAAAEALHLSQPTQSRQLKDLEDELGKPLLIRGARRVTLTDEGIILRKRAEEILSLSEKALDEISRAGEDISGNVYIGAGETDAFRYLAQAISAVQQQYPKIRFHISSGDTSDVMEELDRGLIDFGLLFGPADTQRFETWRIPTRDTWNVLMRRDSPLASKEAICPEDLWDKPLIFNRHIREGDFFMNWLRKSISEIHIAATYNLLFNGAIMVEEGVGYALGLDGIINVSGDSPLCVRPLDPPMDAGLGLVWKRYQPLSKPAEVFLKALMEINGP